MAPALAPLVAAPSDLDYLGTVPDSADCRCEGSSEREAHESVVMKTWFESLVTTLTLMVMVNAANAGETVLFRDDFSNAEKSVSQWVGTDGNRLACRDGKGVVTHPQEWGFVKLAAPLKADFGKRTFLEVDVETADGFWLLKLIDGQGNWHHLAEDRNFRKARIELNNVLHKFEGVASFNILIGGAQKPGNRVTFRSVKVLQTDEASTDFSASLLNYRPPGKGRYGDAIPFYHDGTYHAYFLLDGHGPLTWEHLTSTDLIHWKEQPQALDHGEQGSPEEGLGTGSVVHDPSSKQFFAFYTGFNAANDLKKAEPGKGHPDGGQQIMIATSPDTIHWTKHPDKTFVGDGVHYHNISQGPFVHGNHACRDPYVHWNEEEKVWDMVFLAETAGEGQRTAYARAISANLLDWKQVEPLKQIQAHDCPDLFQVNDTWYMIKGHSFYQTAENRHGPFNKEKQFDTDIHAVPKRMFDGKRHVLVGWIRDTAGSTDNGNMLWGGFQCIPREMYQGPNKELLSKPVDEILTLFTETAVKLHPQTVHRKKSIAVPRNYMLEMTLVIQPRSGTDAAPACRIIFRDQAGDAPTGYPLTLRPRSREAEFTMSKKHTWKRVCPTVDWSGEIKVREFVTNSIIECFVDDAEAFSIRAYDFLSGALSIEPVGADVEIRGLTVRTLPAGFEGVAVRRAGGGE